MYVYNSPCQLYVLLPGMTDLYWSDFLHCQHYVTISYILLKIINICCITLVGILKIIFTGFRNKHKESNFIYFVVWILDLSLFDKIQIWKVSNKFWLHPTKMYKYTINFANSPFYWTQYSGHRLKILVDNPKYTNIILVGKQKYCYVFELHLLSRSKGYII